MKQTKIIWPLLVITRLKVFQMGVLLKKKLPKSNTNIAQIKNEIISYPTIKKKLQH